TSPSQRAIALGSLIDGLKKRWLTARISTETRCAPTVPSAIPKPVMLVIMCSLLSYCPATTLSNSRDAVRSVEKVPSDPVHVDRARHQVARNLVVDRPHQVP